VTIARSIARPIASRIASRTTIIGGGSPTTIQGTFSVSDSSPNLGDDVTFEVTLSSTAVGTYSFQLTRNGSNVSGATTNPFTVTDWEVGDDGDYRMVVTDSGNSEVRTFGPIGVFANEPGDGPTLIADPAITGELTQNSTLTFDVGMWDGATSFEIEIVSTSPTDTLLERQSVTGATTGDIETVVGSSLVLRVWASNDDGTTYAESDPFGPIEEEGDIWIGGFVLSPDPMHNPTPIGFTNEYTLLSPNISGNLYAAPPGYGWLSADTTDYAGVSSSDARIRGRQGANANTRFRINLPEPGVYLIYVALGTGSGTVAPRFRIVDHNTDGTVLSTLHQINESSSVTTGSTQAMDANGVVTSRADWTAASLYGGTPVEITSVNGIISIGRPVSSGSTHLNCFTILKKRL